MRRPYLVGLTGSIGMGKSTVAGMFRDAGLAVWDADAAVHRLYAEGGEAVAVMRDLRPAAVADGAVDRRCLKAWMAEDATALAQIERAVHPLVARDRARFVSQASEGIIVLDVPLLFEIGEDGRMDLVVVVTAPPEVQNSRVLSRPGMTEAQFRSILAKQMPDAEKRRRADVVITSVNLAETKRQVAELIERIEEERRNA